MSDGWKLGTKLGTMRGPEAGQVLKMADSSNALDAYNRETGGAIFLNYKLTSPDCMAALETALAHLIPGLSKAQYSAVRALMLENNEIVIREMERRASQRRAET